LDEFVILPNHFHAIVWITDRIANNLSVGANGHSPLRFAPYTDRLKSKPNPPQMRPKSISSLVTGFKSATTTKINNVRNVQKISV